jgi:hypothetical protein
VVLWSVPALALPRSGSIGRWRLCRPPSQPGFPELPWRTRDILNTNYQSAKRNITHNMASVQNNLEDPPQGTVYLSLSFLAGINRCIGLVLLRLSREIMLTTWKTALEQATDNEKAVKLSEDELADRVCLSRWASCRSSDARRFR